MKANDLTGQRFGKLVAVQRIDGGSSKWLCHCDCGNDKIVYGTNLMNGKTQSCGCSKTAHGDSRSKLYNVHAQMVRIGVCDEWREYPAFKSWAMDNGYSEGARIKRKDVNQVFGPDNCIIS